MKYVLSILDIIAALILVFVTASYMASEDVCGTIFGCTAIWCWFYAKNH